MLTRLLILYADEFDKVRVQHDLLIDADREWLGIGFGVLYRDIDLECSEIGAADSLGNSSGRRQRAAVVIDPDIVPETNALYDQRIALPMTH